MRSCSDRDTSLRSYLYVYVGWLGMYVLLTTYGYMDLQHTSGVIMLREGKMKRVRTTIAIPESKHNELKLAAAERGWSLNYELLYRLGVMSLPHQSDVTVTSELRQSDVTPTSLPHHNDITPTSESHQSDANQHISGLDAILEADGMDDSGDIARRDSPAQARRKAQIEAIQTAWSELFPNQTVLQAQRAKIWLQLSGDCAEDIWKVMEATAGREDVRSPVGYIEGTLKKLKEKRDTERAKDAELEADWELAKTAAMNDPQWGGWTEADRKWAE